LSLQAKDLVPILQEIPSSAFDSQTAVDARNMLIGWDRRALRGGEEGSIMQYWYRELSKLASSETDKKFWNDPIFIYNLLNGTHGAFDPACNITSSLPNATISCLEAAAWTFEKAVHQSSHKRGVHRIAPLWGEEVHHAVFPHALLDGTPLACLANRDVPHGGDMSTVNVG
jgi:acyl-homoserine lactone acylase PvdQ